jgi:ATP-binding cassette subfamily B protein
MAGRTSFVIAQRVSTVQSADQILVLDRGRIVARGRHTELLQDSPIYAELYRLQLGNQPGLEEVELKGEQPAWSDSSPFEGRWP